MEDPRGAIGYLQKCRNENSRSGRNPELPTFANILDLTLERANHKVAEDVESVTRRRVSFTHVFLQPRETYQLFGCFLKVSRLALAPFILPSPSDAI